MSDASELDYLLDDWPGDHAIAVCNPSAILARGGDTSAVRRIASITKLFTTYAVLIAIEEGSVSLDDPAGAPGSTVRHLMAHAGGYGFEGTDPIAAVGSRRIYSNGGIEVLARHLSERTSMAFTEYLNMGVLEPLGITPAKPDTNPAHGLHLSLEELMRFAQELLAPTLIAAETLSMATAPVWPELGGVLPGYGLMEPNEWGLGFEIRGQKSPHWTAPTHSQETFGHFGGSGSFLWIDPVRSLAAATIGTVPFGDWAVERWAGTNLEILDRFDPR